MRIVVGGEALPGDVAQSHSSIAITGDIYGHVSPEVARQAMDVLGEALDR
jgi:hypothetical protein